MRVSLPHTLGKEEVRRRLREHGHELGDNFPAGLAEVTNSWPHEDRMDLAITAMGQEMRGGIDIAEDQLVIELDLPPLLGFFKDKIEGAMRNHGAKLLEKD